MTSRGVQAEALYKAYGRTEALRGVSMVIEPGELVAVTGPVWVWKVHLVAVPGRNRASRSG